MLRRSWIRVVAATLTAFAAHWAAAEAVAPDALIKKVSGEVIEAVKTDKAIQAGDVKPIMTLVDAKILPHVNFQRMTASAVGRYWRQATPEQQKRLQEEFKTLLVRTYSSSMVRFKTAQIDVKPAAQYNNGGREAVVKSEVTIPGNADKKNVSIDYTLYKGAQGWKIFNVSVEGASLVTVYRTQFGEEIRRNGIDGLIKQLKDKNDNGKSA